MPLPLPFLLPTPPTRLSVLAVAAALLACCGREGAAYDQPALPSEIAAELGLDAYVGLISPAVESVDGAVTTYTFDPAQGPMCLRGEPFRMGVRDTGGEDLVIFLQGGGACWSEFCLAVTAAPPGVFSAGLLDPEDEQSPVHGWNVAYLPYCDASFFTGDADHDDDGDGTDDRFHRGLHNLTGGLTAAAERFPEPRRILLAGSSGGAYGMLLAPALVRSFYPDAELFIFADSGLGLARADDRSFIDTILREFNVERFVPPDCTDCRRNGHLAAVAGWYLDRDPDARVAHFSSWYDTIIGRTFLQVEATELRDAIKTETERLSAAHPERYRRFIVDGIRHTTLLGNPAGIVGTDISKVELPEGALQTLLGGGLELGNIHETELEGISIAAWTAAMLAGDKATWRDLVEPPGEPGY